MKRTSFARLAFVSAVVISLPISACSFFTQKATDENGMESSSSVSSSDNQMLSTPNVSYTGMLDSMGSSVYMEGSHKLILDDGQMIVLESTDANLNLDAYIGKKVEVRGSVQPTVEQGGTLMRVTEIVVLSMQSSSDESVVLSSLSSSLSSMSGKMCGGIAGIDCEEGQVCADDPSDSCDPQKGGVDCSGICVVTITSSTSPSQINSSSVSSIKVMSSSSVLSSSSAQASILSSSSSVASSVNQAMEQQIVSMSKQGYDQASFWTQKYCTSHIGFCIPVHKNWYFKSFGATTTNLWHVEFGQSEIDELGQGAIVLNLVAGTSASMSATDGQVKVQGSEVIGFKDTADGRHFELIADARLQAAVEYMLSQITPYELAQ